MRGSRPHATIEQAIERDRIVRRGERVVIACSGGADSAALVALLSAVAKPMNLELSVAHVNHGLRPSAWQDECVALRLAATFELPIDVAALESGGDEAALRDGRYAALQAAAARFGAGVIATAHHAEDQSETVLLALFRGAGPDGLTGMRPRRTVAPGIELARPLLRFPAAVLRAYCHLHGLPYAVDPSNADADYRRNALRHALEALRPSFPGLDEAVARAAELVGDEDRASERAGLRRRVREHLAAEGALRDVDFAHVEAAVRAIETGRSGTFLMKAGVRMEIHRGAIAGITRQ
ncbi:MAG: tRNA lysidine(34) synthetase TilS [Candidatus Eremiobacteraeota bacterium]|nr:tRNA lysidine(34) synthetase TilS [Candidatus Eremiobacteraeota bacterium]MBV8434532.1 tRNA lysidine(34) synthetase TilS [Candidatus Eremiobacteraeota bacterium]MBV8655863.1 tRNA lysidine(34) synthetase TilS [Candidatus Eremiobacteraeota bacterium]